MTTGEAVDCKECFRTVENTWQIIAVATQKVETEAGQPPVEEIYGNCRAT